MTGDLMRRVLPFVVLIACSDGGAAGPEDEAPDITIAGVADGGSYDAPVTITISVEPGTFTARLNGDLFQSGTTVEEPGGYQLTVTAVNGSATSRDTVDFEIQEPVGGTTDVLIIRLLDLRLGTFGAPGDAILVTDSSAAGVFHALIDAGARTLPPGDQASMEEGYVRARLSALGVDTLRFMQLSHAHTDHFAGMDEILSSAIHVTSFVHPGQQRPTLSSYVALIDLAEATADSVRVPAAPYVLELGGGPVATTVTMLPPHPDYDGLVPEESINDGSIGTLIEHAGFRIFLAGDGENDANARWQAAFAEQSGNVDVLKVGHHGANNATQTWWLQHSSFESAVISANGTTHPRKAALDNLHAVDEDVYCTNVHGEIRVTVDDAGGYTVTVEKNAGAPCVPGSAANT